MRSQIRREYLRLKPLLAALSGQSAVASCAPMPPGSHRRSHADRRIVVAVPDDAGDFRKALDAFVWDFLRLRQEIEGREKITPGRAQTQREEYQWLRRRVADAYRSIEEPFAEFVRAEPEHDPRFTDHLGLDDVDDVPADYPITAWWRALTLAEALDNFQAADEGHLREALHRHHAVLDAFADWSRRPPEPEVRTVAVNAAVPRQPSARTKDSWINNQWVVGIGVTTIGGLIVVLIAYVLSH